MGLIKINDKEAWGDDIWWFSAIRGTILGGPYKKNHNVLGSILASPDLGKLPRGGGDPHLSCRGPKPQP